MSMTHLADNIASALAVVFLIGVCVVALLLGALQVSAWMVGAQR